MQTDNNYQAFDSQDFKIAVVGNKFTGKTQLILRIVRKDFSCQYSADVSLIALCIINMGKGQ